MKISKKPLKIGGTVLRPIQFDEGGLKALQQLWTAHLQGLGDVATELSLPENIITAIDVINDSVISPMLSKHLSS